MSNDFSTVSINGTNMCQPKHYQLDLCATSHQNILLDMAMDLTDGLLQLS
jgi:hypothetical protein